MLGAETQDILDRNDDRPGDAGEEGADKIPV